jgi:hypothetical protein
VGEIIFLSPLPSAVQRTYIESEHKGNKKCCKCLSRTPSISPAIPARRERNFRDGAKKSNINLRADSEGKQRLRIKHPKLCSKNKGGAPKGNRNARKHGRYTKEIRVLRIAVRRMAAELKLAAALVKAEAARMDAGTFMRLREGGLSPRSLWPSEL